MLLAPDPAGGLTTSGKPTSFAKPAAAAAESASRCRAQGTPAARSTDFICALSRKLRAVRIHAGDAQALPSLRDWYLQLLQYRQEPLNRANMLANALHRRSDLPGVKSVVDPPVRGQAAPSSDGRLPSGSQVTRASSVSGRPRCCLDEPRRRVEQIGRDKSSDHHG